MDYYASKGANRLLNDEQIHQFINSTVLPHHRSLTRNEPRLKERYPEMEVATCAYREPEIVTPTPPVKSGTYIEANRLLSDEQIHQFITSTVLPHHRSLVENEPRVNERCPEPEVATVTCAYRRPETDTATPPVMSGTYMEVEPMRKQYLPKSVQIVLQNTDPTRTVERVAQRWVNQLLSDEQIHQFIESTVLPHHHRLTNPRKSANNIPKRIQRETIVVPRTITAHQRAPDQENEREATRVLKEIHIPETNNVIQKMQARTIRVSHGGPEILGIPREIQRECSKETCIPEIVSVLHEIPGEAIWNSPEIVDVQPEQLEEVVVAPLKDDETQKTQYGVTIPQREDQREESSSQIQGQSTKVKATATVKQTRRKQKWNKWTALKNKVKNKHKALACFKKKGKIIRSLGIVRKSHKFNRRYIRKILQRVTKSGKKTESHKKVQSQNDGEYGELLDNDVKKFLKKFSLDKLSISPQDPAESRKPVDPSPWDPEHTLVSGDRHSRQDLKGPERFVPYQDCYIDLDLFL